MGSTTAKPGTYLIIHNPSGRFYIGSTNNLQRRVSGHRCMLKKGQHPNKNLQSVFTRLEDLSVEVAIASTVEQARAGEQAMLDEYLNDPDCCNVGTGANSTWLPGTVPESVIQKARERSIGNKFAKGHVVSDEARDAVRQANTGLKRSQDTLDKMSAAKDRFKRPVEIDGVVYDSARDAASILGINHETVRTRLASNSVSFASWKYI